MSLSPAQLDRCAGVLLGLAAGDALGAGYEFAAPPPGEAEMIGGGLGGWDPGEWTDDTQMALCIAEETATGSLDALAVAERFLSWYRSGPADVGIQTRAVLSSAERATEVPVRAARYFESHPDNSAGNGSLMRTAPVALAHLGDDGALLASAMAVSSLTHADPLAGEACALWCIAIDRAVREGHLEGIFDGLALLPRARRSFWEERLEEARTGPPSRFTPNGFVVTALQAAISSIWSTPVPGDLPCRHLQDSLQTAVKVGNDTDTVAAIAGSLLGARWGSSALPVDWQLALHGWPGYRARDLVRLAVLSARGGEPDSSGWPSAPDLTEYYERTGPAEPFVHPLAEDPGVLLANIAGAAVTEADVVVSLCRMGPAQPPHSDRAEIWLLDSAEPADNPNLEFILLDLGRAISRWREEGKTVLVHCVQAESRTPAVAAAYLARRDGMSGIDALAAVKSQVPQARSNQVFEEALGRLARR